MQRCKRCTFDSPGLTSESEVYPGLFVISDNNAVGVVPFIPRYFVAAFYAENVQHLRRCPPYYMHNPG
ncbi:lipopolysaccharide modification acyltransferase [Segatella salivae]|uniref:lipopolysaccharide modification acyltransferase n=1 Tax=Segatella salivae TaxID=228604 RepID=UPI001CB4C415|nr:lipopolysaccharide modification acyltransferase [Segatella salivae]MBF1557112.1 lipopolysaccharide modification acyltransferase [Segatella salivae]